MYNDELVSIIVPVYNVEKYLPECIDSILNQSYKNLEIILVDDGSTDESGRICDLYAKEDRRIKVVHKQNGGLSDARNAGIEESKGEYLAFVDSDDSIQYHYVEKMLNVMANSHCDVVQCAYERIFEDGRHVPYGVISLEADGRTIQNYFYESIYNPEGFDVACNKLYKRGLFAQIRYPLGRLHEDIATTYKVLFEATKIVVIPEVLYHYRVRQGSITSGESLQSLLDWQEAEAERLQFYSQNDMIQMKKLSLKRYYYRLYICIRHREIRKEQRESFIRISNKLAKEILKDSGYSVKEKMGILWTWIKIILRLD